MGNNEQTTVEETLNINKYLIFIYDKTITTILSGHSNSQVFSVFWETRSSPGKSNKIHYPNSGKKKTFCMIKKGKNIFSAVADFKQSKSKMSVFKIVIPCNLHCNLSLDF